MHQIERLKMRIDELATHMATTVTALQQMSEILQDILAVEDVPDTLESIGCPNSVVLPLKWVGITTVGQVIRRTEDELLSIRNFGKTKLQLLKDCLAAKGRGLKAE